MNQRLKQLITEIPKAELHFHLDSVPAELLFRIAERNKVKLPFSSVEDANKAYRAASNLEEFLRLWEMGQTALLTEQDYYDVVMDAGRDAKEQNIIYREAMFCYQGAAEPRGIPLEMMMEAFSAAKKDVMKQYGVDIQYIAGIDRTKSGAESLAFVEKISKYKDTLPLVAIGMECQEYGYPAYTHRDAFLRARELGIYRTAHAGEEVGPESIWDSINNTKVNRIDHGITSIRDDDLVEYLKEKNMMLTICPYSNVFINVLPSMDQCPIKALADRGVKVCINSDDPGIMGYSLIDNFVAVADTFHLSEDEIIQYVRNPFLYNFNGSQYLPVVDAWIENWKKAQ